MSLSRAADAGLSRPDLTRARWMLMAFFALNGLMMSSWLTRLPSLRADLGLSEARLGAVLLVGAVGALLTVVASGSILTRCGGRVTLGVSTALFLAGFLLMGLGSALGSVAVLCAGIVLNGMAFALGNVPMNVESAAVERLLGRSVLPQFHAAFSIGAVIGSLTGAACAHAGTPVLVQFAVTGVVATLWRGLSIRHIVIDTRVRPEGVSGRDDASRRMASSRPAADRPGISSRRVRGSRRSSGTSALGAWRERRTLLIGLVIMAAALSEGAANDWLSIAVVDGFRATEAVGALVFGLFLASMTAVRVAGTRLLDRLGRVRVLRGAGMASIAGLLLFGFAPSLPLAAAGVVLWGMGAALAVPVGIAAASDDPLRAAPRVAVVSAFASLAALAAPPLLGLAAEALGARHALVLIVAGLLVSVSVAAQAERLPDARAGVPGVLPAPGVPEGRRGQAPTGASPDSTSATAPASTVSVSTPPVAPSLCAQEDVRPPEAQDARPDAPRPDAPRPDAPRPDTPRRRVLPPRRRIRDRERVGA